MATDLERLVVQLSADVKGFNRELQKAVGISNRQARAIERRWQQAGARLDGIGKNMARNLVAPLSGIGAVLGTRELIRLTDAWTDLSSRVNNAAGSVEMGEEVLRRLGEIARNTYSDLTNTAEVYLLNATALRELGYTTEQTLDFVATLNDALVVSGAKGQQAEQVINALSKAMALGKLSGENLNTVVSVGGRFAEALAASMGVSTNQLRKLGAQGKITTRELFGVTSQMAKLRKEAEDMPATIGDGFVLLNNALMEYVGTADTAAGISSKIAEALVILADNFDEVADKALQFASVIAAALLGRALGRMLAVVPEAVLALRAMATAMASGTLAAGGLAAALGPIGLAVGGLAAAVYVLEGYQNSAAKAADIHKDALNRLSGATETASKKNAVYRAELRNSILLEIAAAKEAVERIKATKSSYAFGGFFEDIIPGLTGPNQAIAELEETIAGLEKALSRIPEVAIPNTAGELRKALEELNLPPIDVSTDPDSGKGANKWQQELDRWNERIALIRATTDAQRGLNPLVDDYGYAVEKAKAQQELLNAAKRAGLTIDDPLTLQIEQLSEAYAAATVEAAKLTERQDNIRKQAQEMADFNKQLFRGIVDGFIEGKNAADVFADALQNIGNKLLDLAFDSLFSGGGSGGGLLGGLLSELFGGFRESGGPVQSGRAYVVGEKRPELFVPQQNGVIIPKIPKSISSGGGSVTYAPVIDARGASPEAVARLESILAQDKASFEARVVKTVNQSSRNRMIQ